MAALLLAVAAGCGVNRTGLGGLDGSSRPGDAPLSDAPLSVVDREPEAQGGAGHPGQGGGPLGVGGGGGLVGAGGGTIGAAGSRDLDAASDITDGDGEGADVADRPGDARPDRGGIDTPTDIPTDAATCGASALCDSASAVTVTLPGGRFTGTTAGASLDQGSCGGARGPEAVFKLVLTERSDVFITTHGTGFDTVVYMRNGCCGPEIGCNDDADNRRTSVLASRGLAAGSYDIFVDGGKQSPAAGAFTIDIYATAANVLPTDDCGSPGRVANQPVTSTTCGLENDFAPLSTGCLSAPLTTSFDAVYYFLLDAPSTVAFNTCSNTCIDTVLSIRDVCTRPNTQQACNDDFCAPTDGICPAGGRPTQSRVTATLPAGLHYLILDSHVLATATGCGPFTITPVNVPQ